MNCSLMFASTAIIQDTGKIRATYNFPHVTVFNAFLFLCNTIQIRFTEITRSSESSETLYRPTTLKEHPQILIANLTKVTQNMSQIKYLVITWMGFKPNMIQLDTKL